MLALVKQSVIGILFLSLCIHLSVVLPAYLGLGLDDELKKATNRRLDPSILLIRVYCLFMNTNEPLTSRINL